MGHLSLVGGWVGYVPSRIGPSPLVESAVRALVGVHTSLAHKDAASRTSYLRSQVSALSLLRKTLDPPSTGATCRDDIALAVAPLSCADHSLGALGPSVRQHRAGLTALLKGQCRCSVHYDKEEPSQVVKALVIWNFMGIYQLPCALGQPSPFDEPRYWNIEPRTVHLVDSPLSIRNLERASLQLLIRIPRLIALVRAIRQGNASTETSFAAIRLASDLLVFENKASEDELLYSVKVGRETDPVARNIVPYSFIFDGPASFRAACVYW